MRALLVGWIFATAALAAADSHWLDRVSPVITAAEKKTYLTLPVGDRQRFEENFWAGRAISGEDYFSRLAYIDTTFGSGKPGSGANTDQGRVYLSLGPPTKIARLASSRIFVPIDIWYYDSVPALALDTELRLMFYQKNNTGFPRLYSPTLDTVRSLLLPQASVLGMFGPNDSVTESSIRQQLNVSPAEDEVVTAAVGVASGIKYSGNDEILGQVMSPATLLGRAQKTDVKSRLILFHPEIAVMQTASAYGGVQVDLRCDLQAAHEIDMEVFDGMTAVYENHLHLDFATARLVHYTHRLDLLPGFYRVLLSVDRRTSAQELRIPEKPVLGEVVRVDASAVLGHRHTPFEFDGRQVSLNPDGMMAFVSVPHAGNVTWIVRRGTAVVLRSVVNAVGYSTFDLASAGLPPGVYRIEAMMDSESKTAPLLIQPEVRHADAGTALSFNANLTPALRYAFVGHQWLLRGQLDMARRSVQASLASRTTVEAEVELARLDALSGQLDDSRSRLRKILAAQPNNFQALAVYAFVEARLQDYPAAAQLYQRALSIQDSPALRLALEKLPVQ